MFDARTHLHCLAVHVIENLMVGRPCAHSNFPHI